METYGPTNTNHITNICPNVYIATLGLNVAVAFDANYNFGNNIKIFAISSEA
jgi:hypothetical protein